MSLIDRLENACKSRGVELTRKPNGHFQINGPLLVNYYPFSQHKTAYIAKTNSGFRGVTPEQAVEMAFNPPAGLKKTKRRKSYRKSKLRMLSKNPYCHWCSVSLNEKTATVDHVIPISKGGLNNASNMVLACGRCNQLRGSKMPELKKSNNGK